MNKNFSWEAFNKMPLIGIMRNLPVEQSGTMADHFHDCGLTTLEVTMNSHGAEQTITSLATKFKGKLNIGAGTVCSMEDLGMALSAGASFVVTPVLNEEVVRSCVSENIPVFPGAYTPSEIYKAWTLGAAMVKVFPANRLGPQYMKEVLAPLKQIKLLPTGGITLDNFTEFFKAGASGAGIGSDLFPPAFIKNSQWNDLRNLFREFVERYNNFRG